MLWPMAFLLIQVSLAHSAPQASIWKLGSVGQSCGQVCGLSTKCVEDRWPTTLAEFNQIAAEVGHSCSWISEVSDVNTYVTPSLVFSSSDTTYCLYPTSLTATPRCEDSSAEHARFCPCSNSANTKQPRNYVEKHARGTCYGNVLGDVSGSLSVANVDACKRQCDMTSACAFLSFCPSGTSGCTEQLENHCLLFSTCTEVHDMYYGYTTYRVQEQAVGVAGDRVTWTMSNEYVPKGSVGVVTGDCSIYSDGTLRSVKVRFPNWYGTEREACFLLEQLVKVQGQCVPKDGWGDDFICGTYSEAACGQPGAKDEDPTRCMWQAANAVYPTGYPTEYPTESQASTTSSTTSQAVYVAGDRVKNTKRPIKSWTVGSVKLSLSSLQGADAMSIVAELKTSKHQDFLSATIATTHGLSAVKILDVGFARRLGSATASRIQIKFEGVGTPIPNTSPSVFHKTLETHFQQHGLKINSASIDFTVHSEELQETEKAQEKSMVALSLAVVVAGALCLCITTLLLVVVVKRKCERKKAIAMVSTSVPAVVVSTEPNSESDLNMGTKPVTKAVGDDDDEICSCSTKTPSSVDVNDLDLTFEVSSSPSICVAQSTRS